MFQLHFQGRQCILSKDALKHLSNEDISLEMLKEIVENGDNYKNDKMSKGEVGRAITKGKEIVFVKLLPSYSFSTTEEVWIIKHIGIRRR